jgi:hypothetical protein
MQMSLPFEVRAPLRQVQYVLGAVDEYHLWNAAVRGTGVDLRWDFRVSPTRQRSLAASVTSMSDVTTISLYRGPFAVLRFDLAPAAATAGRTTVTASVWVSPAFAVVPKNAIVRRAVRNLAGQLEQRARWLHNAPDSDFVATELSLVSSRATRTASLEQLLSVSRELEGGILAVESANSCCLLDLDRARFARANSSTDLRRLVDFGRWESFVDVVCDGDDVVIVPTNGAARVRIRARATSVV